MAFKNGRLYICDRCGASAFCKCTGEKEMDGGYTRWNTFEPLPEGWSMASDTEKIHNICPACTAEYKKLIKEFEGSEDK